MCEYKRTEKFIEGTDNMLSSLTLLIIVVYLRFYNYSMTWLLHDMGTYQIIGDLRAYRKTTLLGTLNIGLNTPQNMKNFLLCKISDLPKKKKSTAI